MMTGFFIESELDEIKLSPQSEELLGTKYKRKRPKHQKRWGPLFTFYGGKYRAAKHYPRPMYDTIIEPFAGSAGYSTRYFRMNIILYGISPVIFGVWDYLIRSTPTEIRRLPSRVDNVDDLSICQEAKWLIGFWFVHGHASPAKSPSKWVRDYDDGWSGPVKNSIAFRSQLIKHWKVHNQSYITSPNIEATWYIDAPYSTKAGRLYKNQVESYEELAEFCRERKGQVMVCEQHGADWLPFREFRYIQSTRAQSREVIWTNGPHPTKGFGLI